MRKLLIRPIIAAAGVLTSMACAGSGQVLPVIHDPMVTPATVGPTSATVSLPATPTPTITVKPLATPTVRPNPSPSPTKSPSIPSGTLALFHWTSFGDDTKRVIAPDGTTVTWETGARGIARFVPTAGRSEVIRTVTTASYSKSTIYPLTVGDQLFSIRDWGSDWTAKNKDFTIEEMDPWTGAVLSSTQIAAEWFVIVGKEVYYRREVTSDFYGKVVGGGQIMARILGTFEERELPLQNSRFGSVEGNLVSVAGTSIRLHDGQTGRVVSQVAVPPGLLDRIWPNPWSIFFGDDAVYWTAKTGLPNQIEIVRAPLNGIVETVVTFDLEGYETDVVIDAHKGRVTIGSIRSAPPRGLAITQVFVVDLKDGSVTELPDLPFIPASIFEAGGGLQALVLP